MGGGCREEVGRIKIVGRGLRRSEVDLCLQNLTDPDRCKPQSFLLALPFRRKTGE